MNAYLSARLVNSLATGHYGMSAYPRSSMSGYSYKSGGSYGGAQYNDLDWNRRGPHSGFPMPAYYGGETRSMKSYGSQGGQPIYVYQNSEARSQRSGMAGGQSRHFQPPPGGSEVRSLRSGTHPGGYYPNPSDSRSLRSNNMGQSRQIAPIGGQSETHSMKSHSEHRVNNPHKSANGMPEQGEHRMRNNQDEDLDDNQENHRRRRPGASTSFTLPEKEHTRPTRSQLLPVK